MEILLYVILFIQKMQHYEYFMPHYIIANRIERLKKTANASLESLCLKFSRYYDYFLNSFKSSNRIIIDFDTLYVRIKILCTQKVTL